MVLVEVLGDDPHVRDCNVILYSVTSVIVGGLHDILYSKDG